MECNAGFHNAFKNFVGMSNPKATFIKTKKGSCNQVRSENCDFDLSETQDYGLHSPNDSVYDSDYSDNGFPLPCTSSVKNSTLSRGYGFEESSAEYSNTCNSYSSDHSDDVMEGEIYINGDFENNPSLENAVASVVHEFEINSSNEDSCESDSLEAIFVPLKSISSDSTINASCAVTSQYNGHMESYPKDSEMKSSSICEGNNNGFDILHNRNDSPKSCLFSNSPNKENFHCNMQCVSSHCIAEEGPKVVVEVAPSRDISLAEISALRNIDGDSEKESCRDDSGTYDITVAQNMKFSNQYCVSEACNTQFKPKDDKSGHYDKHSSGQHQTSVLPLASWMEKSVKEDLHECDYGINLCKGNGVQLHCIPQISAEIANTSPNIALVIHNILYDAPGNNKNRFSKACIKKNILNFSGFPFDEHSAQYAEKRISLSRIPFRVLNDISRIFLGGNFFHKCNIVEKVLNFLLKPANNRNCDEDSNGKCDRKDVSKEDTHQLSPSAQGRNCIVVLERMSEEDIQKKMKEASEGKYNEDSNKQVVVATVEQSNNQRRSSRPTYVMPHFIKTGPGVKLKQLPGLTKNLHKTYEAIIHILHVVFYGTTLGREESIYNILEFSGFPSCQDEWIVQRQMFMKVIGMHDLRNMCRVLRLDPIEYNKSGLIACLLTFFHKPSVGLMKTNRSGSRGRGRVSTEISQPKLKNTVEDAQPSLNMDNFEISDVRKELKAFSKIRTNIECATPEDLLALHDVIFAKPCESYQIHQKLLDFDGFKFIESSTDYQFRKTLMYYMSFENITKIASLFDLAGSDMLQCYQQELSASLLKFLLKPSDEALSILNRIANRLTSSKNAISSHLDHDIPCIENSVQNSDSHHPQLIQDGTHLNIRNAAQSKLTVQFSPKADFQPYDKHEVKRPFSLVDKSSLPGNELVSYSVNNAASDIQPAKKFAMCHSSSSEDESEAIPLATFISHPSDSELKQTIQEIIEANVRSISMKGLIHAVYNMYPDFDLHYRANFIRSKARKVLSKMQQNVRQSGLSSSQKSISFSYNGKISYHDYANNLESVSKRGMCITSSSSCSNI